MVEVSYYPVCSLEATARDYAESVAGVAELLDIKLMEIPDWNCCGATAGHSLDHRISLNLSARNLGLSLNQPQPIVVPCALCFNRLKSAQKELIEDHSAVTPEIARLGTDYDRVEVVELNNYLTSPEIMALIEKRKVTSLNGLRPVCYYGCQGQRPPGVTDREDYEHPEGLDRLLKLLGAEVKEWSFKTDCCGASHSLARPDIVFTLVGRLYNHALEAGANCIVTGCQMCQANLDLYQEEISKEMNREVYLPVFYFTELLGVALGHRAAAVDDRPDARRGGPQRPAGDRFAAEQVVERRRYLAVVPERKVAAEGEDAVDDLPGAVHRGVEEPRVAGVIEHGVDAAAQIGPVDRHGFTGGGPCRRGRAAGCGQAGRRKDRGSRDRHAANRGGAGCVTNRNVHGVAAGGKRPV